MTLAALLLQSGGAVLFASHLAGLHAAHYVFCSLLLTAGACLAGSRGRLPRHGWTWLALANALTAVSYIGFFFALRYLPAAVVGALEVGVAVLTAMAFACAREQRGLPRARLLTCAGIAAGCTLLGWSAQDRGVVEHGWTLAMAALVCCVASGVCSALTVHVCKRMQGLGWTPATIVAHRFHLALGLALAWSWLEAPSAIPADPRLLSALVAIGALCVLAPQWLLQRAISRTDPLSVQLWTGLQPAMALGLSHLSPAYRWHGPTFVAVLLVTVSVLADLRLQEGWQPPRPLAGRLAGWRAGG